MAKTKQIKITVHGTWYSLSRNNNSVKALKKNKKN